jgi:hypothetical protein
VESGHGRVRRIDHGHADGDAPGAGEPPVEVADLFPVQRTAHEHQMCVVVGPGAGQIDAVAAETAAPGDLVRHAGGGQRVFHGA